MKSLALSYIMYGAGAIYALLAIYFVFWSMQIAMFSIPVAPPLDAIMRGRAETFLCASFAFFGLGVLFILVPQIAKQRQQ